MFPSIALFDILSIPFKRSQLGLFHGKTKQYGNNNPFSKKKTRRTWLPNIQNKRLYSETLQQTLKVRLTTRAMKTMEKYGGFDNYILKTKHQLLGQEGMRLRMKLHEAQGRPTTLPPEKDELKSKARVLMKLRRALRSPVAREEYKKEMEKKKERQRVNEKERLLLRREKKLEVDVSAQPAATGEVEPVVATAA